MERAVWYDEYGLNDPAVYRLVGGITVHVKRQWLNKTLVITSLMVITGMVLWNITSWGLVMKIGSQGYWLCSFNN